MKRSSPQCWMFPCSKGSVCTKAAANGKRKLRCHHKIPGTFLLERELSLRSLCSLIPKPHQVRAYGHPTARPNSAGVEYGKDYTHPHREEGAERAAESRIADESSASPLVSNHKVDLPRHPRKRELGGHKHFRQIRRCVRPRCPQTPFEGSVTRDGWVLLQQARTSTIETRLQRRRVTSVNIDVNQEKSIKSTCSFLSVRELSHAEHLCCSRLG